MGRSLRVAGALVLAGLSVPVLGVSPALADTTQITANNAAYFNSLGFAKPDELPATPPNPADQADGVDPGHLPVAARPGAEEDKVSFVYFELSDIDATAVISKAVVKMKVAEGGNNRSYGTVTPESVIACKAGPEGFAGDEAGAIAQAPARLCDAFKASAKVSADGKVWEFDVTGIAQEWLTTDNQGLALRPALGSQGPFQIVFAPMDQHVLDVEYAVEDLGETLIPPALDTDTGIGTGTSTPVDMGGGFVPAPAPAPGLDGAAAAPPVAAPAPQPQAAAGPATTGTSVVPVSSTRPSGSFWLGSLVLAAALALVSLVMGDATSAAARRESRLSRTLRERQRTAGLGTRALSA